MIFFINKVRDDNTVVNLYAYNSMSNPDVKSWINLCFHDKSYEYDYDAYSTVTLFESKNKYITDAFLKILGTPVILAKDKVSSYDFFLDVASGGRISFNSKMFLKEKHEENKPWFISQVKPFGKKLPNGELQPRLCHQHLVFLITEQNSDNGDYDLLLTTREKACQSKLLVTLRHKNFKIRVISIPWIFWNKLPQQTYLLVQDSNKNNLDTYELTTRITRKGKTINTLKHTDDFKNEPLSDTGLANETQTEDKPSEESNQQMKSFATRERKGYNEGKPYNSRNKSSGKQGRYQQRKHQ